ncbi:hypothetical protein SO802_034351 [Lithocarpus litseifolius]|uniref:Uncharacterized protein n=1 Tax=Lithocarpus litseifolius TaxID=425828 RepID=A0AAW2BFQ1_9ROSI
MTFSIFAKLVVLALLEPIFGMNMFVLGMKYTTATVAATMINALLAMTFILACLVRLENLNFKSKRTYAKIVGKFQKQANLCQDSRDYTWICFFGAIGNVIVALVIEKDKAAWAIHWDVKLLAVLYGGIGSTGLASYIQACILKDRGAVLFTAFAPISMIMVAVLSSWLLAEKMYMGSYCMCVVLDKVPEGNWLCEECMLEEKIEKEINIKIKKQLEHQKHHSCIKAWKALEILAL